MNDWLDKIWALLGQWETEQYPEEATIYRAAELRAVLNEIPRQDAPTQEELKRTAFDLRYSGRADGADMIERCARALGYEVKPKGTDE